MSRLRAIEPDRAEGTAKVLLDAVNERYGMVPNLARTLANSPAALQDYHALGEALESGVLSPKSGNSYHLPFRRPMIAATVWRPTGRLAKQWV